MRGNTSISGGATAATLYARANAGDYEQDAGEECMTMIAKKCRIVCLEREGTSRMGNPRYFAVFAESNGTYLSGTTKANAGICYSIGNYKTKLVNVTYHITKRGSVIFDDIEESE